jgi:hypothetical protein
MLLIVDDYWFQIFGITGSGLLSIDTTFLKNQLNSVEDSRVMDSLLNIN